MVSGKGFADFPRGCRLPGSGNLGSEAAYRVQDLDGGIMAGSSQLAGKNDVAVENGPGGVANGFVEIVSFHQDREKAGDGAALEIPGALKDFRQQVEDRRSVAFLTGWLAGRQPDLALGHCQPR